MSAPLSALPPELTEAILIHAARAAPASLAAFAQTCRAHRALVYAPPDARLWRDVFLAAFDDPRPAAPDWGSEFRRRVWAAHYLRGRAAPAAPAAIQGPPRPSSPDDPAAVASRELSPARADPALRDALALETLLAVLHTARPAPPSPAAAPPTSLALVDLDPSLVDPDPSLAAGHPIFPPPRPRAPDGEGRNVPWAQALLARGLPPHLTRELAGAGRAQSASELRRAQALGRLLAYTGFLPVAGEGAEPPLEDAEPLEGGEPEGADDAVTAPGSVSTARTAQARRARRVARMRVYNMRYLAPARHWGPFLAVAPPDGAPTKPRDDALLAPVLALFARHASSSGSDADSDAGEDDAYEDAETDGDDGPLLARSGPDDAYLPPAGPPARAAPPPAAQLRADWAWLGAARVVVEANLRDAGAGAGLAGLAALGGLRAGSAPAGELGDGLGRGVGEGEWDWAGVTGVWRRCVCWMDYRDLIMHNLSSEFQDALTEAVRIVPLRLRAAGFAPGAPGRPTILVEGETAGAAPAGPRRVQGSVRALPDGSVRWSLTSFADGAAEWVSEGVQLGGERAAMGVLGLWTGALHERMDPLGPFWMWKVA